MSSATAVARYIRRGWSPVPIPSGTKGPRLANWQDLRLRKEEDIPRYFPNGQNVGIINGDASGGLVTVDLDCPEALKLAGRFLEPTLTSGRDSTPDSHWWYVCPRLAHKAFETTDDGTILELRSTDHQTVVEPSIHPSGERYQWSRSGLEVIEVEPSDLLQAGRRLAVASLIARYLPEHKDRGGRGGRYHYALAVAGYLLRHGPDAREVTNLLRASWDACGWLGIERDREGSYRGIERAVNDSADKIAQNDPTTGGRKLEEMAAGLPRKIADFMGWDRTDYREQRRHYEPSDLGNVGRFKDLFEDRVRWCPARKRFLVWTGKRWVFDDRGDAVKLAHEAVRSIYKDAANEPDPDRQKQIVRFALASQNEARINAMMNQAKPYLYISMDDLDTDEWLLNCQNGTLDLRTGNLRDHDPTDLITRIVPVDYDPGAEAPRFTSFLKETLVEDDVISFIKRYAGYSATGSTRERLFAILHGNGRNGKSTLVELMHDVLGDYATNTDVETLLVKKNQTVGNEVAALKGARFVSASEVERNRRLAESKIKQLTGRDTVTARFLFNEPFDFRPEFKLWLSTNNKPVIQGTDDAIWDRIRLVPFGVRFEHGADPHLRDRLRSELSGVLAWIVAGCLEWQEHGLQEPESVTEATRQYREEMDTLAAFIEDRCVVHEDAVAPATPLYQQYRMWCDSGGEKRETQKMFTMRLRERGFAHERITRGEHKGRKGWFGIGIRVNPEDPEPDYMKPSIIHGASERTLESSPSEPRVKEGSPAQTSSFAGTYQGDEVHSEPSEPKNYKNPSVEPRVKTESSKRFTSVHSVHSGPSDSEYPADDLPNFGPSAYDRKVEERTASAEWETEDL